jgi:hypothetical protein
MVRVYRGSAAIDPCRDRTFLNGETMSMPDAAVPGIFETGSHPGGHRPRLRATLVTRASRSNHDLV